MPTRVSLWCSRLIEAGWLAVLLVTPLFFQTSTVRVFEPDKMMIVRTIALVMAAAWIVRVIDSRLRPPAGEPGRMPRALLWPTLLLVVAYVLATLASLTPWASLFGSYQRGQGLYSVLALVIIFVLILNDLRRRDQVERVVTAVVLGSIPAALFAVMQGLGIQPGVWRGLYGGRVFGTLGNPIFLAGYLLMVMPLTVARLIVPATPSTGEEGASEGAGAGVVVPMVRQFVYGIALVLQLAAFGLAYSRGPLLGLAAAVVFFALTLAAVRGRRQLVVGVSVAALIVGVLLGALNLPPVQAALASAPAPLARLTTLMDVSQGSTGAVRLLLWEGAAQAAGSQPARIPIGYGPETEIITLSANVSPAIHYQEARDLLPDRSHNESFDRLIETGALGLVAYLWLIAAAVYLIFRRLGLASPGPDTILYGVVVALGTAGAALLPVVLGLPLYLGIGSALGLLVGVWIFMLIQAFTNRSGGSISREGQWLLAALLAALVGHLVDISLGPANPVNRVMFWAFLALIGALAARPRLVGATEPEAAPAPAPAVKAAGAKASSGGKSTSAGGAKAAPTPRAPRPLPPPLFLPTSASAYGVMAAIVMAVLTYAFIPLDGFRADANGYAIVWFMLLSIVLGSALLWFETRVEAVRAGTLPRAFWTIPVGAVVGLVVVLAARTGIWLANGDSVLLLYLFLVLFLAALALLASWLPKPPVPVGQGNSTAIFLYAALALVVLAVIVFGNVLPIQADMYMASADAYARVGDIGSALILGQNAMTLQNREPEYVRKMVEYVAAASGSVSSANDRDAGFDKAVQLAEYAASLTPNDGNARFNVGHAYLLWAQATGDQTRRNNLLARAAQNYQRATQINPNSPDYYVEWALASQLAGQSDDVVRAALNQALQLDPQNPDAYFGLGRLYQARNESDNAEQAYLKGLSVDPDSQRAVPAYSALGEIYVKSNKVDQALQASKKAVELAPDSWVNRVNLALVYQRAGRGTEALNEAQTAYNLAPSDAKQKVVDIISQIQQPQPTAP
ncbi:MAG: tetratricopeptide repeat protein [Anaerolineae bacterium]